MQEMIQGDPFKRPSAESSHEKFNELYSCLTERQLRSRVVYRSELPIARFYRDCRHVLRTSVWRINRTPAVPTPKQAPVPT